MGTSVVFRAGMVYMNKKIMIIDLSDNKKSSLQNMLSSEFIVRGAGIESSETDFSDFKPDLVIVRVREVSGDGSALLQQLKRIKEYAKVPVLVFSTIVNIDFYIQCLKAGILYHIKSPASRQYLFRKIKTVLHESLFVDNENEECGFSLILSGRSYDITLNKKELVTFLLSTMDNAAHQTKLLQDILKKKHILFSSSAQAEIVDVSQSLTDEESRLFNELDRAVSKNEFCLYYQPVMEITSGRIAGFEALIRWKHPGRGIIGPDSFISVLEKTPLIEDLGFWIVEEAARQISQWYREFGFSFPFRVNVNLSARQFVLSELCDRIIEIVSEQQIPSESLAFEITESAFMEDMDSANMMLLKLKANNHYIYMDDFGTGYSSLSYLQHFPVDVLKIDKSFVEWMHLDEQSRVIVRTIVDLAHNMHMSVVAEGVESQEHLGMLKEFNCDYGQGYLFSKPMDASTAGDFIKIHGK